MLPLLPESETRVPGDRPLSVGDPEDRHDLLVHVPNASVPCVAAERDEIVLAWRGKLDDEELYELTVSHGGRAKRGWWDRVQPRSLGWVTARARDGLLVGFVNVAWDGGDHAFLLDPKTRGSFQRRGIGTRLVRRAAEQARTAGCEWLHVDFEIHLRAFYYEACGFTPTNAGLIDLRSPR